jgi:hypothetical protein
MNQTGSVADVAGYLGSIDPGRCEREGDWCLIAGLLFELAEIYRPGVETGWSPGLEPSNPKTKSSQIFRQSDRWKFTRTAG